MTSGTLWQPEPQTLALRPYQSAAIDGLREALAAGHRRVILCAPTGSGKTEMAFHLIQEARARDSRVAFVADRRVLVKQTSERLAGYGIPHGIAMASDTTGRGERIQVCSAQTIEKRDYLSALDLLVIDEAHVQRQAITEFAKRWGGPVIGLTATPLTRGLGETYEHVVNATTTDALLAAGYLAPLRIYAATEIDMTGAKKTVGGEWQKSEVRERARPIIGDIVSEWARMTQLHFGGPVKTLVFSADVAHGEELCRSFHAAGYDFRQSTYRDDGDDTEALVEGFRCGEFTGLVSVEKFTKGFDVPDVLCMVGARPYATSLASVIQQLGRGMRTADGKDYCLYLDHAGNMAGWYDEVCEIWAHGVDRLPEESKRKQSKRREGGERRDVVCSGCSFVVPTGATACPACGLERKRRRTSAEVVAGRMEALERPSRDWMEQRRWTWQQLCRIALDRKGDEAPAKRFALAQYRSLYDVWPRWEFEPTEGAADRRVERKVKQQLIAYFKGKQTRRGAA